MCTFLLQKGELWDICGGFVWWVYCLPQKLKDNPIQTKNSQEITHSSPERVRYGVSSKSELFVTFASFISKDMSIIHHQYHDGWCPGDTRSQGISSHIIGLVHLVIGRDYISTCTSPILMMTRKCNLKNWYNWDKLTSGHLNSLFLLFLILLPTRKLHSTKQVWQFKTFLYGCSWYHYKLKFHLKLLLSQGPMS